MAAGHVTALLWGRAEVGPYFQDGGPSCDGVAMRRGGSTALFPRWRRMTRWGCYGNERKYGRLQDGDAARDDDLTDQHRKCCCISKAAAHGAMAPLWERPEALKWLHIT